MLYSYGEKEDSWACRWLGDLGCVLRDFRCFVPSQPCLLAIGA